MFLMYEKLTTQETLVLIKKLHIAHRNIILYWSVGQTGYDWNYLAYNEFQRASVTLNWYCSLVFIGIPSLKKSDLF